jgi:hypothetical protein
MPSWAASSRGYQSLIDMLTLSDAVTDPSRRHSLPGRCDRTASVNHFLEAKFAKYNSEATHPEEFLNHQFGLDQAMTIIAANVAGSG